METIEIFMENFTKSRKEKDNDALVRILKNLPNCLEHISKNDHERTLEIIFDEQKGLLRFIQLTLQLNDTVNLRMALEESFNVLQFIMELFKQEYESYILQTSDICFYCIKTICWFYIRKNAAETLRKLIELYSNCQFELDVIIKHYIDSYLRLYSRKDVSVFYIVLGAIARYCPKTENMIKFVNRIFCNLLTDLNNQIKPIGVRQPVEIKIYLECYWNMFTNFVPFEGELEQSVYFEKLYFYLIKFCEINSEKPLRNKTIHLLSTYMKYFSSFILKDYNNWHTSMNNILTDKNDIIIAALKAFYKMIASYILKENNEEIFLYLRNYLTLNLCNKDSPPYKLELIIYGLGELSIVYQKYLPMEILDIFQKIALRTLHFYTQDDKLDNNYEELAHYLQALTKILQHTPNVSLHQINIIIELSILFAKRFTELKEKNRIYAINALKNTFVNISHLEQNFQHEYFNSFFREGILWSCSHTLLIDLELQENIQNSPEPPICYKNFLPLWQSLFKIDDENKFSSYLIIQIFNEFILVLISFIDKLNLSVKIQENNTLSDTFSLLKAENETDFRFFVNLIDLYMDIFENIESILFENWTEKLVLYFIKYSYKHSLISGFYKLIRVIFIFSNNENNFSESTCELISQYMCNVVKLVCGFSGELQLSCLYLIFNTPIFFMKDLINQMTPVFKVAFTIGLTDLSLAFCALNTLENWINNPDIRGSNNFLKSIIPYIEPYLSSEESLIDKLEGIEKNKKKPVKNARNVDINESLEELQKRILLFYGSIDSTILLDFIHEKSIYTNASWGNKTFFECKLLFPDICLKIYFDKFIPRIIELTKSSDHKTKISACQLLGSLLTIILFEKSIDQCFNKNLYLTVLRLASDSNDTVRNLYYPFTIELIHDISYSAIMGKNYSEDFIDSLFECLTEEFNTCVRDCCGLYLKEFVEWSIKKSWDGNINCNILIQRISSRIIDWSLNPSNKKRLAAAMAFNYLYIFFEKHKQIYWLEFFHAFIKCMEDCDDIRIISSLNYIEKIVKGNPSLFEIKSPNKKSLDYPDESFSGALIWLFNYCGSLNIKCRHKCIELFENLLPLVPEYESVTKVLMNKVNEIALKHLEKHFEHITLNNARALLRSLDFYIWIFKKKFLPLEFFRRLEDSFEDDFFISFTKFIYTIIRQNLQINDTINSNSLMETEELTNLISEIILKILEFISIILLENNLKNKFWNDSLQLLIVYCTLSPREIGLTAKNLEVINELPKQLEMLLTLMMNNLPEESYVKCREYFLIEIRKNDEHFIEINDVINNKKDILTIKQFVEGLFILKKSKFLNFEKEVNFTMSRVKDIITNIFQALKIEIMDNDSCKILDKDVKDYLEELMKLLFEDCQLEMIEYLVKLIMNDDCLINLHGSIVTHGKYFLETFKAPIFYYMSKNLSEAMKIFDEFLIEHTDKILFIIEELLMYARYNKITVSEILADAVIDRCINYQRVLNDIENRKIRFFNINRIAVSLKRRPAEAMKKDGKSSDLYSWILEQLIISTDLEKKSMILRNFLICLVDEESMDSNPELLIVFRQLRDEDTNVWLKKLESDEILRFQAISCFRILLKMLAVTKSVLLYQITIKYAAGMHKYLSRENIKEFLSTYSANLSDANALKSLHSAHKMFMDLNLSEERFDVLKYFLLPSMELNKASVVEKYYEEKCQEMILYVTKKIDENSGNIVDRKKLIVTKIGFYNIFELIFAKFELKFLNVTDPVLKIEKPINQILVQQTLNVRKLSAECIETKEITRLLHCAAFNCCIAMVSLKKEEKFYKTIFFEDRKQNQLIWEKIVDCERKYNFTESTKAVRRNRKTLINIRRNDYKNEGNPIERADSYFHRNNLISLTLLEDINAYDLNDLGILSEVEAKAEEDRRLGLSFENDQLNDHECMPMISGVLVHVFNNEICSLPDSEESRGDVADLPDCLKLFRNAFGTQRDNVRIFLMKIVANAKNAFVPFVKTFFRPLAGSIHRYLRSNPLNYVVRDVLVLLVQSKYKPSDEHEINDARELVERLIESAPDGSSRVYRYNLEIIESLSSLWSSQLVWPRVLERNSTANPDLVVGASLALLRAGLRGILSSEPLRQLVETQVQRWTDEESAVLARFETLGWILRLEDEDSYRARLPGLVALLGGMQLRNRDRWARCVYALQRGWGPEARPGPLLRLVEPRQLPEHLRPEAFELFLSRLPRLDPDRLRAELPLLDLAGELRERSEVCTGPVLRILAALVPRLPEVEVLPLLDLAAGLAISGASTEHRLLGQEAVREAYERYKDVRYLRLLVRGLDDPSEKIREQLLNFWRHRVTLPTTSYERLLALLDLYAPESGTTFTRLFCFLMMESTVKEPVEDRPLEDEEKEEEEVPAILSWASASSQAPLFAPSLLSRMRLPGGRDYLSGVGRSAPRRMLDPSQNELSWRSDGPTVRSTSTSYRRTAGKKPNHRRLRLSDRNDVRVSRRNFVESVNQLFARDWLFCKDFAVTLVCRLIKFWKEGDKPETLLGKLRGKFDRILSERPERPEEDDSFVAVVLEIVLRSKVTNVEAKVVGKICRRLGLDSLGILLLEQEETPEWRTEENSQPKRGRFEYEDKRKWLELASMYKSRGEIDVASSIFKRRDLFSRDIREGALMQVDNNWLEAKTSYEMAYEIASAPEKEHCLEGMFESLSQLSSWSEINKKIEIILNGDYDSVWESPKAKFLLPWIFQSQLLKALEDFTANKELENVSFIGNFDSWIRNRESVVKSTFGEELAVLFLCGQRTDGSAKHSLECCLEQLREQWIRLCPLSEKIRARLLVKLRGIHNINAYIETLRSSDIEKATRDLIRYWDLRVPSVNDDLFSWNIHVYYRLAFANLLHEKLDEVAEDSSILDELLAAGVRQRLKISDLAMRLKNNVVAKKHTLRSDVIVNHLSDDFSKLKHDFMLIASKYKFFCGKSMSDVKKKYKYYLGSWEIAESIINYENADLSMQINVKHHLFDLTLEMKSSAERSREFLNLIFENDFATKNLKMQEVDNIFEALQNYSFNSLKSVCESSDDKEMAESYTKFGKYCYSLLNGAYHHDSIISDEFVSSILTGMCLGSLEAAHYFPCLLKYEYYRNNEQTVEIFTSKSENVPSWLFLSWQGQILSYLSKPIIARILIPIVRRLVNDYPNGIMYNFRQTYNALPELRANPEIRGMYESLFGDRKIETFFKAMHYVCQPEHYLRYHLLKLVDSGADFKNLTKDLTSIREIFSKDDEDSLLKGSIYKVLDKYQSQLLDLEIRGDREYARKWLDAAIRSLYLSMKKRLKETGSESTSLLDYSPYLGHFRGEELELEIPGQYRDNRKPIPRYHTKILKFDHFIRVMDSKCNPVMIRIIGNDAQAYDFLVKFGEDLRLDQRLQQIFNITNKTLNTDKNCKQRYLSVNTYQVVPLSASLGFIQWVDDTKSLAEFVQFSLKDKAIIENVSMKYQNWIEKAGKSQKKSDCYKMALMKYNSKEVISKMNEFIDHFRLDCLRKTFVNLSPSCECFVSLRQNFITSYATMCTIHWITGIGDRHLGNTLIQLKTGKCYGIDFESAFGTGIDQSIPELVPFRLTSQILGLLKPFDEQVLFGITMTHVLSALRKERGPMLACLNVFILEPLDWSKFVNKQLNEEHREDIKWIPKKKIAIVEKKLNGVKPSTIMLEELSNMHNDDDDVENQYFSKYTHIINGTDSHRTSRRSMMNNESLTPEEQVQCLLEQAKDLNILGRMWVGWWPFV